MKLDGQWKIGTQNLRNITEKKFSEQVNIGEKMGDKWDTHQTIGMISIVQHQQLSIRGN